MFNNFSYLYNYFLKQFSENKSKQLKIAKKNYLKISYFMFLKKENCFFFVQHIFCFFYTTENFDNY